MITKCMRLMGIVGLLALILALGVGCPVIQEFVVFSDLALEDAVRGAIGKPFGLLMRSDLLGLLELDARGLGISDLTGLEYCTNVTFLDLDDNNIADLTPLANLDNLEFLYLENNDITNITPLAGLFYLNQVTLFSNQVWDISPLVDNALHSPGFGDGEGDFVTLDAEDFLNSNGDFLSADIAEDVATLAAENVEVVFTEPGTE